ncbi:MAG: cation:proton antiporter [Flavobacteriales bacterium]|nr:cation:proton antiporter [Flavobacteriales bacterium]
MVKLGHHDIIVFLIALGLILIIARLFAELFNQFKLPSVLGEIIAGVLLGPSVLGFFWPESFEYLFPFIAHPEFTSTIPVQYAMDSMINISVIMLLFVAGMEVQLPLVIEQGKVALSTTFFSMLIPIAVGYLGVHFLPDLFMATDGDVGLVGFFIGVVLSITALPVIARILIDMKLFKTRIGMTIIASAMLIDLLGWLIFSVLLSVIEGGSSGVDLTYTLVSIILFGGFMLTIGTRLIDKSLPWVQTKFAWPGGVLALSFGLCFLGAAFTESIGIHSILGAFIVGIAFGESANLRDRTREIIHQFITNVFAPIFFVSIGLYVNFVENFNFSLIAILLVLAYSSKILGARIGAGLGGLSKKDAWTVGVSMNTHGVLEIILGSLAMSVGLINEEVFVAIVVLVVVSIITSAPMIKRTINK